MSEKEFINNLSSVLADIRKLDTKKIFLNNKDILNHIKENVPTIKHSQDTRTTVYADDLWGQWVETKDDGTVVVHDDWVTNPNRNSAWLSNVKAVQDNKAYSEITTDDEGNFTGVVEDSVIANIQTEMIKNGYYMFSSTPLASFNSDLSSLVDGYRMFISTSLTSFSGDLSNLVNGGSMFYSSSLTSFSGDLSSLVDGSVMFRDTSLKSFSGDLSSLVDGTVMFYNTPLTSFSGDLSNLVDGSSMFNSTSLESFSGDLSNLVNGGSMFYSTSLTSFSGDLSNLVNGGSMFYSTSLTSFSGDLSSLVYGYKMFNSTSLESFSGDLSSLVNGEGMFAYTSLKSFSGDLSSLVDGSGMFIKCKLTPQSVMYIVESIRNLTEEKAKYESGEIPWVTPDTTTRPVTYSAPFGFLEYGQYVYTFNNPNPYTTIILNVGKLTLGIDVTNNSDTIEQQLQTFAEGCLYESWEKLKQAFVDKGWTVTFQYGGTDKEIILPEDE